jgi:hypothetical protein
MPSGRSRPPRTVCGNAFNILGKARRALRLAGRGDEWAAFEVEATSADYQHLLAVVMKWFEVE